MVHNPWVFTFGILGNIISSVVYLAPVPTFFRVYRKKSTEGFHSIPYVVALFSAMLWVYYGTLKASAFLLITVNGFGCLVETIYIIIFIVYAPKKAKILTVKLLVLLDCGGFLAITLLSHFFAKGSTRPQIVGWFCVALSAGGFAAPLSVMRLVIRTKSVEFMPFTLSFCLTLCAIMWLLYGILLNDFIIVLPNILGVVFGAVQMVLYVFYKYCRKGTKEYKQSEEIVGVAKPSSNRIDSVPSISISYDNEECKDQKQDDQSEPNMTTMEAFNQVQPRECLVV